MTGASPAVWRHPKSALEEEEVVVVVLVRAWMDAASEDVAAAASTARDERTARIVLAVCPSH